MLLIGTINKNSSINGIDNIIGFIFLMLIFGAIDHINADMIIVSKMIKLKLVKIIYSE